MAGRTSEKKVAKRLDAKVTAGSGAGNSKGDIRLSQFLVEAKSTIHRTIGLKLDWLVKIKHEARGLGGGFDPALTITFTTEDGSPVKDGEWVVIPLDVWKSLKEPK